MQNYEKLGAFYLGRHHDPDDAEKEAGLLLYDSKDLVTHAVCVGMTGSGKTGLCIGLLEEAAIDGVPALVIDPKGDLANLLLTFPELSPQDFKPWVNEDDARRKGLTADEFAANQADLWRNGLASWEQDGDRIRRLRQAADFAVYTPGSEAGLPVSILASFQAPPAEVIEDRDLYSDRVSTTATSLLGLLGIDADPIRSREHIFLSSVLDHLWRQGLDAELASLIGAIQSPPFKQVGVLDLDTFYPAKDRLELAMLLNNLLAAPGFQSWMSGQSLDVGDLLYTPTGKPRVAIFSIAHLSDQERMFFVSLLLNQTLSWMRSRPGTTSLRALLYMDEIFGFMPPVAEPPSKKPLLTLLKQARAYGLGVVLATQNPVDLDYKGLSNTGTWFIGRLQTERDKARVLDGLEGAAGGGFDRKTMERIVSGLGKRVFLLHNVHEDGPVIFQTRWVMSYLRGPLTRQQIKTLMAGRKSELPAAPVAAAAATPATARAASSAAARPTRVPTVAAAVPRPVLPDTVQQVYLPGDEDGSSLAPGLLGMARVDYVDSKSKRTLRSDEVTLWLPLDEDMLEVDWRDAEELAVDERDLDREATAAGAWGALPRAATKARSYTSWKRRLADYLYRNRQLERFKCAALREVSKPGESERDFRVRLGDLAREQRDEQITKLRKKFATKAATLEERLRKAKQRVEKEKEQSKTRKLQTVLSVGATLLGAFTGRKKLSATTLSRATSAMTGASRSRSEAQDIERAEETAEAMIERIAELNAELEAEIDGLEERFDPTSVELEEVVVRPRKTDVSVRLLALGWRPGG